MQRKLFQKIFTATITFILLLTGVASGAENKNGLCKELQLADIPVADNTNNWHVPEGSMRLVQHYNNQLVAGSDAYCVLPGGQTPTWSSPSCKGRTLWYGHDGIDLHRKGGPANVDDVFALSNAIVILSHKDKLHGRWGANIILATRPNKYSNEILTFQYAHLYEEHKNNKLIYTSRKVDACDIVETGQSLAKVGGTGRWPTHLHFSVRRWANVEALNKSIGTKGDELFGKGYARASNILKTKHFLDPLGLIYQSFLDFQQDENGNMTGDKNLMPFVINMRAYGIEYGLYDGTYGAFKPVKRRELARWLKIATMQENKDQQIATFDDVAKNDPDFSYIEALTTYPELVSVINAEHTCSSSGHNFCPNEEVNRAEALKMTVLAFYANEYQSFYNDYFWFIKAESFAGQLAGVLGIDQSMLFTDIKGDDWFSSYVYFGVKKGIVAIQKDHHFNPANSVTRQEMAKWVTLGYEEIHSLGPIGKTCGSIVCNQGEFCDMFELKCKQYASCIPTETTYCEVGGGYDACETNFQCNQGETKTQPCGNGGTETAFCNENCQWGQFGECKGSGPCKAGEQSSCGNCGIMICNTSNQWSPCQNQGECNAGITESKSCNQVGTQTHTCSSNCTWGNYTACTAICTPGQTQTQSCQSGSYTGTQTKTCNQTGNWGYWETCQVPQECTPGQTQTQSCQSGSYTGTQTKTCDQTGHWGIWESCTVQCECSSGACCDGCNYYSSTYGCKSWYEYRCTGNNPGDDAQKQQKRQSCNGYSSSCNGSIQSYGWFTQENCSTSQVCEMNNGISQCVADSTCSDQYILPTTQSCSSNPNASGNPTLCMNIQKISGSTFKYQICKQSGSFTSNYDYYLSDDSYLIKFTKYTGKANQQCSEWQPFSTSYINGYGSTNGAGLVVKVSSPTGCTEQACQYHTGGITIRKECL